MIRLLTFLLLLPTISFGQHSFFEDFSTTAYKDELTTTAEWDTTASQLTLPAFMPSIIGNFDAPSDAHCIAVAGNLALMGDYIHGLHVLDISEPSSPDLVSTIETPGHALDVAIAGDLVFVADYGSGLTVLDISDPSNPAVVGNCDTPGIARAVTVSGNYAFVGDNESGLQVIDISDPSNPIIVGNHDTHQAFGVVVSGDLAFVADVSPGLKVIDISDPTNPFLVSSIDTPGSVIGVAVSGDMAFLADENAGLQVVDISNPSIPVFVGNCDTPGNARAVVVSGDLAFIADQHSGLQVIDISDPSSPSIISSCDTPGVAKGVRVTGDLAFVCDDAYGMQIIRVRQLNSPILEGSYDTPGLARDVAISGDYAFVSDWDAGLQVINIADPSSPVFAGNCPTVDKARGVTFAGYHAYVADYGGGLSVIDISLPSSPLVVGNYDTPYNTWDVAVSGNLALLADGDGGLQVVDISDPANPNLTGTCNTPVYALAVVASGNLAFVADREGGLQLIDISVPSSPVIIGSYNTPGWAIGVAVSGDLAFVADRESGLQAIDISDPTIPILVGSIDTPSQAQDVYLEGDLAFVADYENGLLVIDISDPSNLTILGNIDTPSEARGVVVEGNNAYVADYSSGLQVIQVYQYEINTMGNIGQSLVVDNASDLILRARLTSIETEGVTWEVSVDAGDNWQAFIPNGDWTQISDPGVDLLWRTLHAWSPGVNPTVSELTLDWLVEEGSIVSITDIPNDQGGWLRLSFMRSGYDFMDEDELPVAGYQIFRRVDDVLLRNRIREEGAKPASIDSDEFRLQSFSPSHIRMLDDRVYLLGNDWPIRGEMPPGTWEVLNWVAAQQIDEYLVAAPTLADSTAQDGINWSVFVTTAHTTTPSIWFASQPDSGYSVDNIAPGIPGGFTVDHDPDGISHLGWEESEDSDFQFFRVYRGVTQNYEIAPNLIVHETVSTSWTDIEGGIGFYYKLTALDYAGNESEPASPDEVTDLEDAPAATFVLYQNSPNPFNPTTSIQFEVPITSTLSVSVYDLAGRIVAKLVDEIEYSPGQHSVFWKGIDDNGIPVTSGVYFYRLESENYSHTCKMLLLK